MRFSHSAISLRLPDMNTFRPSFPETAGSRRVAFVVDDDRQVRSYIRTVLEAQHFMVMSFARASDALDALVGAKGNTSILISDLEMPEMNGIIFTREALRHFPELPVLMISGCPAIANTDAPVPLLLKPFLPGALRAAVEQSVHRQLARSAAALPSIGVGVGDCPGSQPSDASVRNSGRKVCTL